MTIKTKAIDISEFRLKIHSLLERIERHLKSCMQAQISFGICSICPKNITIGPPSQEVYQELERRATEYFKTTTAISYHLRYTDPPHLPGHKYPKNSGTPDDYRVIYQIPQFDQAWYTTEFAREFIYCPDEKEVSYSLEWFEIQLESIRYTPLLHQTLTEDTIIQNIQTNLDRLGLPVFEEFINEYAVQDQNLPMSKEDKKKWANRDLDWKKRYPFMDKLFNKNLSLRDYYGIAHQKAASSRNPMLKDLLWSFVKAIEESLILITPLLS